MNPFLITITFLSLMSMITTTTVKQLIGRAYENNLYHSFLAASIDTEKACVKAALNEVKLSGGERDPDPDRDDKRKQKQAKKTSQIRRSPPLQFDWDRPPDNSRLNFYLLLEEDSKNSQDHPCTLNEIAARLMRNLYGRCSFFHEIPEVEYKILDILRRKKEAMEGFEYADEIGSIPLDDEKIQAIFYQMLKGGSLDDNTTYPSLLDFITFDKDYLSNNKIKPLSSEMKKINLFFVSKELLGAILPNDASVTLFLKEREKLWEKIFAFEKTRKEIKEVSGDKLNRTTLKDDLKTLLTETLSQTGVDPILYINVFDFSLGKIGHILLIEDKRTKLTMREKIPKSKVKS